MVSPLEFLTGWGVATWQLLADSAVYLVLGFLLAGVISAFVSERNLNHLIGRGRYKQVLRAALVGVPLPLCSCSVLPVAHQLRQTGLSKGGTMSFLISTPESGVDSILLTYSLTDPLMTVARPITAFITAFAAGWIENSVDRSEEGAAETAALESPSQTSRVCDCEHDRAPENTDVEKSIVRRVGRGVRYAFTDIVGDLAVYLLIGYVLAGLVTVLLGGNLLSFSEQVRTGWESYLAAIVIGLPLYICATSSTPLAAALLAHGFSPGAILVFLIVGPATNVATMVVVGKMLTRWSMVRYLVTIIVVAVLSGLALDQVYRATNASHWIDYSMHAHGVAYLNTACAVFIAALILFFSARQAARRLAR